MLVYICSMCSVLCVCVCICVAHMHMYAYEHLCMLCACVCMFVGTVGSLLLYVPENTV